MYVYYTDPHFFHNRLITVVIALLLTTTALLPPPPPKKNSVLPVTIRDVSLHLVASKLGLPICCLLPAMYAISRCDSISSFSLNGKIATFQTLNNKQNKLELMNMIDFGKFPSVS